LRFRPCTHLTHRPAVANDADAAGKKLPKGHVVIVRVADCHEEPKGVFDPAGVEAIPLAYTSPTEARGALNGSTECLFRIANERVYRASLGGTKTPVEPKAEPAPDYAAMKTADLLAIRNALTSKAAKKWSKSRQALIDEILAASN
jgi:hypothetical protein